VEVDDEGSASSPKLASKGLKLVLWSPLVASPAFGEVASERGVEGECVHVVEPVDSLTSNEGMGDGGRGLLFFLVMVGGARPLGRRKKGSHSLEGAGESGQGVLSSLPEEGGSSESTVDGPARADETDAKEDRFDEGMLLSSHKRTKSSRSVTQSCVILAASSLVFEARDRFTTGRGARLAADDG